MIPDLAYGPRIGKAQLFEGHEGRLARSPNPVPKRSSEVKHVLEHPRLPPKSLIWDETSLPSWLPIGLFDLSTQRLPAHWEFAVFDGQAASGGDSANRWLARLGHPRLVHDDAHSDALIERDPAELQFCFRELLARQENQPPIFEGD